MADQDHPPCLARLAPPTATAPHDRTRSHAVVENTDEAIYLGSRETSELGPHGPVNRAHATALLRARGDDLLDIHSDVSVHAEVKPLRVRAARFRPHRAGSDTDPPSPIPLSRPPSPRGSAALTGFGLEPPDGAEHWNQFSHLGRLFAADRGTVRASVWP